MNASPERAPCIPGTTYRVVISDDHRMYVTINEQDNVPFEVFIRCDIAVLHEWITIHAVQTSRLLQMGVPLVEIASDMLEVHSAGQTNHELPSGGFCPSVVARVGEVYRKHCERA